MHALPRALVFCTFAPESSTVCRFIPDEETLPVPTQARSANDTVRETEIETDVLHVLIGYSSSFLRLVLQPVAG